MCERWCQLIRTKQVEEVEKMLDQKEFSTTSLCSGGLYSTSSRETPLGVAIRYGTFKCCALLLSRGADPSLPCRFNRFITFKNF